jgi:hypothetical protein
MVQGYYTLEEAAHFLGAAPDELKAKARSKELRSFQDRGTLHFRIQDIQELARQRGLNSDPELPLRESIPAKAAEGPSTPRVKGNEIPDVFYFDFDAGTSGEPGGGLLGGPGSGRKSGGRSPSRPAEGSDSDVRLVPEGDDLTFSLGGDSNVKLPGKDSGAKAPAATPRVTKAPSSGAVRSSKLGAPASSGAARPSKVSSTPPSSGRHAHLGSPATPHSPTKSPRPGSAPQPADSGVRLVPMDSDSDVRILGTSADEIDLGASPAASAADSNVRLERIQPPDDVASEPMLLTEEINLDEELKKQEESLKHQSKQPTRVKPKSELRLPAGSPFELSEADLDAPREIRPKQPNMADSSDYDLVPAADGSVSSQEPGSDDFSLGLSDDNQVLGLGTSSDEDSLTGPGSGTSLNNPLDAGISLEENRPEDDGLDFDLSLEVEATPRPGAQAPEADSEFELNLDSSSEMEKAEDTNTGEFELLDLDTSATQAPEGSSEFELSLDAGDAGAPHLDSDSEFELSLDAGDAGGEANSDSEFELTLDDSGSLSGFEVEAPQVKASGDDEETFESDFEVPDVAAAGEGSGEGELESSDFDLALDDSELAAEDESGSQVVALDEEEVVETLDDVEGGEVAAEGEEEAGDFGDLDADEDAAAAEEEAEEEAAVREVVRETYVKAAPWGPLPVVFMLPCVIVMVLVGLMGFELVQSAAGYKAPGVLTKAIGELMGQKIK